MTSTDESINGFSTLLELFAHGVFMNFCFYLVNTQSVYQLFTVSICAKK